MPTDARGRYYGNSENRSEVDVASAARTTTGTGTAFNTDDIGTIMATLVVSAASGTTPTLDVTLETSDAAGSTWTTVGTGFTQQTTTNAGLYKVHTALGYQCRWKWTIAGTTPSFTFAINTTVKRVR
jgi:hypothetical protein